MWNAEESEERLADILLTLWGSGKIESEVSCPDVGTASGMYPKSVMSNGIAQAGNVALAEATLSNKKSGFPQNACTSRTEEDKSDLFDVKGTSSEHVNKKTIGQKSNSALQLANTNDNSQIVDEKGDVYLPNKKKEHDKGPDTPSKEMAPTTQKEHKKGVEPHVSEKLKKDKTVVSPSSNEKFPDTSHPKRGKRHRPRVTKMKKGGAGDAHVSSSSSHKAKAIVGSDTEVLLSSTKQKEGSKDSDRIPGRHSGTKQSAGRVGDSGKSSSHRKLKVDAGSDEQGILLRKLKKLHLKVREGDTSGRRQCSKSKLQKSRYSFDNEMVSSRKTTAKGMEESKSWKKRSRAKISETTGHTLKYDESLVGAKIKVWWQVDKTFYPCTVDSYDPVSKRHKVLYFDGDVEVLLLKNECFKFIGDGERQEEEGNLSPEATSEPESEKMWHSSQHCDHDCGTNGDKGTGTTTTGVLLTAMRASLEASAMLRLLGCQIEAMIRFNEASGEREAALMEENKRLRAAVKKAKERVQAVEGRTREAAR